MGSFPKDMSKPRMGAELPVIGENEFETVPAVASDASHSDVYLRQEEFDDGVDDIQEENLDDVQEEEDRHGGGPPGPPQQDRTNTHRVLSSPQRTGSKGTSQVSCPKGGVADAPRHVLFTPVPSPLEEHARSTSDG